MNEFKVLLYNLKQCTCKQRACVAAPRPHWYNINTANHGRETMKTKHKWPELIWFDAGGAVLGQYPLNDLPLREETVIGLSIEFFNDPEPCMIHRSAVMSRMYMELYEYITANAASGLSQLEFEELPQRLRTFFATEQIKRISVRF